MATTDTTLDHDTCLALTQAIMLPQDIADLAVEEAMVAANILVMQHVQVSGWAFVCSLFFQKISKFLLLL